MPRATLHRSNMWCHLRAEGAWQQLPAAPRESSGSETSAPCHTRPRCQLLARLHKWFSQMLQIKWNKIRPGNKQIEGIKDNNVHPNPQAGQSRKTTALGVMTCESIIVPNLSQIASPEWVALGSVSKTTFPKKTYHFVKTSLQSRQTSAPLHWLMVMATSDIETFDCFMNLYASMFLSNKKVVCFNSSRYI